MQIAVNSFLANHLQQPLPKVPPATNPLNNHQAFPLPDFENECKLRMFQEEGVRWLISCFIEGRSCILGDEVRKELSQLGIL